MAVTRTTRADQVRRRRQQQNKQRYDVSRAPTSSLRSGPLVSKPRRSPSTPTTARSTRIAGVPGIASTSVGVEWPATVTILVTERIPVVTWLEGPQRWWVDADGQKFEARAELPGLLPVTVDDIAAGAIVSTTAAGRGIVPALAVQGALQLRQLRPNIEMLHYDSLHGLSYADGRGWRGYFGVGTDMPQKLAVYEKLVDDLMARGIQPKTISVETVQAPYYSKYSNAIDNDHA